MEILYADSDFEDFLTIRVGDETILVYVTIQRAMLYKDNNNEIKFKADFKYSILHSINPDLLDKTDGYYMVMLKFDKKEIEKAIVDSLGIIFYEEYEKLQDELEQENVEALDEFVTNIVHRELAI